MSYSEILSSIICPKKCVSENKLTNHQLYLKFYDKINEIIELENIFASQKDVKLIKTLFFNENQRRALNYVKFEFDFLDKNKDYLQEVDLIKTYFTSNQNKITKIDKKILNILNKDIIDVNSI